MTQTLDRKNYQLLIENYKQIIGHLVESRTVFRYNKRDTKQQHISLRETVIS